MCGDFFFEEGDELADGGAEVDLAENGVEELLCLVAGPEEVSDEEADDEEEDVRVVLVIDDESGAVVLEVLFDELHSGERLLPEVLCAQVREVDLRDFRVLELVLAFTGV